MAPLQKDSRPDRRRRRPTLRPAREALEPRVVLSATATISPMISLSPDGGSSSPTGLSPQQVRSAYGFDRIMFGSIVGDGAGQTIAIVDAYDDPKLVNSSSPDFASSDLARFDEQYGLPDPPSFTKLNQLGQPGPLPGTDPAGPGAGGGSWENEEAMDVEWAHAMAPAASIVLLEANSGSGSDLYAAESFAARLPGVSVVSLSWGGSEYYGEDMRDQNFQTPKGHQGVTFVASSGDAGAPGIFPAYDSNVLAIGGTVLKVNGDGSIQSETAWSGSGGGISAYLSEPSYQQGVQQTGHRTIPDVAFVGSGDSPVSVYDSYDNPDSPWIGMWGTSLGAPCWSALIAVANQGRVAAGGTTLDGGTQTLPYLYALPATDFHDITGGSNGSFSAGPGYDEVTGLGSPAADRLAPGLAYSGMADHLVIASQPGGSVTAGQSFGLTVDVTKPDGTIDASATGTLTIALANSPGGASLGGTLTATIADGVATFSGLSIDLAGTGYTLSAGGAGFGPLTSSAFDVTPAAAAKLAIAAQPPSSTSAGSAFGLTVEVEDAFGNAVTDDSVTVTAALTGGPAGASMGGTLSVSASGGVAHLDGLSIEQAGTGYAIRISAPGLTGATSFAFAVTPSAPSRLVIAAGPPSSVTAGAGFGLTATVEDAFGNVESSYTGNLTAALASGPAGAVLGGTTTVAASGGVATFSRLGLTLAGSGYEVSVAGAGLGPVTSSAFDVTPGDAAQLVIGSPPPSNLDAGDPFGLGVVAEDAFGNTATGYQGTVTIGLPGGGLGGTLTASANAGTATFDGLSIDRAGGYIISATAPGLAPAASAPIAVAPASPSQLVILSGPPGSPPAGSGFGLTVAVEDDYGNRVADYGGGVSIALAGGPTGATLDGTTSTTARAGVASFVGLTIGQVGTGYTIVASSSGLSTATTEPFAVTPAAPARLVIDAGPPPSVTAGAPFGLSVSVEDAFGNRVDSYGGAVSVALASGPPGVSLSGTTSATAVHGEATFPGLNIDRAGSGIVLDVSAGGLGSVEAAPIRVVPSAPTHLAIVAQPPGQVVAGQSFDLTAVVEDAFGNVATGFDGVVSASLASGPGGALTGAVAANAVDGIATFDGLTLDQAGVGYAIAASADGLDPATSTTIGVGPASPSRLIVTLEPPARVPANRPFAVGVEAVDAFGNVASTFNGLVTAALTNGGPRNLLAGNPAALANRGLALITEAVPRRPGRSYTLTITSPGMTPAITSVFSVTRPTAGGFPSAFRHAFRHQGNRHGLALRKIHHGPLDRPHLGSLRKPHRWHR